ncbi:MAG: phosphatidate cytidylyltransferase [Bacteroidales bacterium]|nr:phosphatidate cytidylyltransferase [Bacteroidales bacterium]MBQ2515509.1 phosphatidate cytidylyltransferase [Bacteroidales bacterium]MBR1500952.1 phosphatidate cytidylyltransferase [Bacteroidales bacterium]
MKNVIIRTISGIGFVLVMLACLLWSQWLFGALVIFMMIGMMSEFFTITMGDRYKVSRALAILAGVVLFALIYLVAAYQMPVKYVALSIVPVIVVMINSLYVEDKTDYAKFSNLYTGLIYIAIPLALSNLVAFRNGHFSGMLLVSFFVLIWSSDIGAYIFGMALGQKYGKKLFPSVSPKKTWIGYWGGMFFAIMAAHILNLTGMLSLPMLHSVILAIVMHVAGVYGDLFESQWKRIYGIKDSGTIIPGHGGLLDRFDSTLLAMPVGALYLSLFDLL